MLLFQKALVASTFLSLALSQANVTGNCLSGRISFDPLRMYQLGSTQTISTLDPALYDFTIDYGPLNSKLAASGLELSVTKDASGRASGVRLSSTRYILYGKISVSMALPKTPGVVSSFITMSDRGDEIDWYALH